MNIVCDIKEGTYTFYLQNKRKRFPAFRTAIVERRTAYGILENGMKYCLGSVANDDVVLMMCGNDKVVFVSPSIVADYKVINEEKRKRKILYGRLCPYCGKAAVLMSSKTFYGEHSDFGWVWGCTPCGAWVGVHKGTSKAFGRLANAELREYKKEAHKYFDWLWERKMKLQNVTKNKARNAGYDWIAKELNIERRYCHIGMFDVDDCKRVIELCKPYYGRRG